MGVAEWTTAALFQIGHMYEAFAKSLRDSPPPPEVKTEDQKAEYQSQIEEFAVPMEERSLDAYENGWKKANELGIYNQWTAKMRDALGRLNSELYPPFKETGFEVRSQGPAAASRAHRDPESARGRRTADGEEVREKGILPSSSFSPRAAGERPWLRARRPPCSCRRRTRSRSAAWCRAYRPRRKGSAIARSRS